MTKKLEIADWCDVQRVLKETYEIWSPGLSRDQYHEFVGMQMAHPWSKRNYSYLLLRDKKNSATPASSMKYYNLKFQSHSQQYKFAGFGAIYTRKDLRGEGYATEMIKLALDRAWYDGCHGALLFSDIGVDYYSRIGFFDLNNERFVLQLNPAHQGSEVHVPIDWTTEAPDITGDTTDWSSCYRIEGALIRTRYLTTSPGQIEYIERHYRRWLRKQSFGVARSRDYLHFKIMRENYLARFSRISWPKLELLTVDHSSASGYAILEYGGRVLRILELVGDENTRRLLWKGVVARARELEAVRIAGWEAILADFAPGFSLNQLDSIDASLANSFQSLMFAEKKKGRAMILPLQDDIEDWFTVCPCPLLEIDHL